MNSISFETEYANYEAAAEIRRDQPSGGLCGQACLRREGFLWQNPDLVQPPVRLTDAETAFLKDWA